MKQKVSRRSPSATARTPAQPSDLKLYRDHYRRLEEYTDRLLEGRCRHTTHFDAHSLGETVSAFAAVFAAWNMEIVFALYVHGGLRFNEAKRLLRPISSRVLSDKLGALGAAGVVLREVNDGRAAYVLTRKGSVVARHLHPLLFYLHNAHA